MDKDGELKTGGWFHCSPTQSLSTRGSSGPYSPVIMGPDQPAVIVFAPFPLVVSAKGLSRISEILFSLHFPFHVHVSVVPLLISVTAWAFLRWRNTHSNHSASTLLAHPPQLCPSTIPLWPTPSLPGVCWVKAILSSFLLGSSLSPLLHPFITLKISVYVLNCKTDISTGKDFFRQQWAPSWISSTPAARYSSAFKHTRAHRWRLTGTHWAGLHAKAWDHSQENRKRISSGTE